MQRFVETVQGGKIIKKETTMFLKALGNARGWALIITSFLVLGCGSTPNFYISSDATNHTGLTDVYISVPQKEITAEIERSQVAAAGGGGLLLALIDVAVENSRASDAEALIQPIKDSLVEIDFVQLFYEHLREELAVVTWLNIQNLKINLDVEEEQKRKNFVEAQADSVLFIDASYSLSSNFSSLKANAFVSLLPKATTLRKFSEKPGSKNAQSLPHHLDNNIHRDSVSSEIILSSADKDKEENAAYLQSNQEKTQNEFKALAKKLARQIANSLSNTRKVSEV